MVSFLSRDNFVRFHSFSIWQYMGLGVLSLCDKRNVSAYTTISGHEYLNTIYRQSQMIQEKYMASKQFQMSVKSVWICHVRTVTFSCTELVMEYACLYTGSHYQCYATLLQNVFNLDTYLYILSCIFIVSIKITTITNAMPVPRRCFADGRVC